MRGGSQARPPRGPFDVGGVAAAPVDSPWRANMSTLPVSPGVHWGEFGTSKNVSTIKKMFIGAVGFSTVSALYVKSSAWYHANNAVSDADLPTAYDPAKLKKFGVNTQA